jgi:hypothetical protein
MLSPIYASTLVALALSARAAATSGAGAAVAWPTMMFGDWTGVPDYAVVGPVAASQFVSFSITPVEPSPSGLPTVILHDSFSPARGHPPMIPGSQQTFYAEGDSLLYCGQLYEYFSANPTAPANVAWLLTFQPANSSATRLVWCDASTPYGCAFLRWEMTVNPVNDTIDMLVLLADPVVHAHFTLTRAAHWSRLDEHARRSRIDAALPFVLHCNFSRPATPSKPARPSACPFHLRSGSTAAARPGSDDNQHTTASSAYQYCFQLNDVMTYRMSHNFNLNSATLDVQVSARVSSPHDWIGIGFDPSFPGMSPADIVLGYVAADGTSCIRTMYAAHYIGAPVDDSSLTISNASIAFNKTSSVITMRFSRPFASGHHNIPTDDSAPPSVLIFATGQGPVASCSDVPPYHMNTRGQRLISWKNPSLVLPDDRKCINI